MPDAAADDIAKIKASPEWAKALEQFGDREWRLDHIYWIRDEGGNRIPFVRNAAQRAYHAASWCRDVIPKARKIGFSTYIAIMICDECMFVGGTVAGIVDRSIDDACDKLAMIRFAYDNLPSGLREANPLLLGNQKELSWANGSTVTVGTTYRGGTPSLLHWSEAGKTSVDTPDQAKEILTGAVQAVPASGRVWVESTSHGSSGIFHDIVERARVSRDTKRPMTRLDFKMQFFGWWMKEEYRLPNNLVVVPIELREYFAEVEAVIGRKIDADQRAWYTKKYEELGPADVKQEFPSTETELFYASIEGAYWKAEISKMRQEGRIGQMVPFDPSRRVNTAWDIGEDCTAIIFQQTDGLRHRIIDYWEEVGSSLQAACGVIHEKKELRRFVYEKHYGPHDLDHRDWAQSSKLRKEVALELGVRFEVVPRVLVKADSIEAARRMLNNTWICSEHAALLVERIENYRKRWNKSLGVFVSDPVHDAASHGSDSLQQLAMGLKPEKVERQSHHVREKPKTTHWGA